jgi:hypothetical protein
LYPEKLDLDGAFPQQIQQLGVELGTVACRGIWELEIVASGGFIDVKCEMVLSGVGIQQAMHAPHAKRIPLPIAG